MSGYIKKFILYTILFAVIGVIIITAFNMPGFLKWFIIFTVVVSSNVAIWTDVSVIRLACFTASLDTYISITFCCKNSFLAGLGLLICLIMISLSLKSDSKLQC